jgi:hypothetical protein
MNRRKALDVVLGIIGLAAWMLYILACRPSWSPDNSKILFPYLTPGTKEAGIALYDRNTGAVKSIFMPPAKEKGWERDSDVGPVAQWESGGSRAIVTWHEKKAKTKKKKEVQIARLQVLVFPVGSDGKTRHFKLQNREADTAMCFPWPEADGNLYVVGKGSLARLDLKTGRSEFRELGDGRDTLFFNRDTEHIVYARDGAETSDAMEIGDLDQNNLTLHPLFVLKEADLAHYGVKDLFPLIAFEPHGSRMATFGKGEEEGQYFIVFCNDSGVQKVVALELPAKVYDLGNLEWASNGKTIYAMVVTPTKDKDVQQFSLGEIPADGGPARLDAIVRVKCDEDDAERLQIALSPDGSTIATATAHLDEGMVKMADRGLFLVDLRDPERKVTKIQFPVSEKGREEIPRQ